jgi:hypothetical protein
MQHPAQPNFGVTAVIYVFIIALVVWRASRPQRMRVVRLWLAPIVLLSISAVSIYSSQMSAPAPAWAMALAIVVGALLGIPVGLLRGRHSNVRLTHRPGVIQIDASLVTMLIWLGAFVVRAMVRFAFGLDTVAATIAGDGVLVFAIAAVIASYYAIYAKYRAVAASAAANMPAEQAPTSQTLR